MKLYRAKGKAQTCRVSHLDGAPISQHDLKSLALLNYGHYTSMRADDHRVRGLSHHLDRLVRDCAMVFDAQLNREKVSEFIRQAADQTLGSLVIRVTIFDPALELGRPSAPAHPHVLVTTRPAAPLPAPPLRVQTLKYTRDLPLVKHVGLFGALCCRRTAQLNGFDDSLFTDEGSFISEGPTWNVGFFDGDRVIWPYADTLAGVTMKLLKQVHEQTVTTPVNLAQLGTITAAFATNTTVGVRPIKQINELTLPEDHAIFDILRKEYMEVPAEPI